MLGTTLFVLFSTTTQLCTQGSLTDYQRADNLRNHFRDQIFQLEIKPNWSDDNQRFWYINRLSGGRHQFVVIESGRRKPAFNHHQLAQKLTSATDQAVDPERLPINQLFFTDQPHLWRFYAHHSWWEFDTKTENLKAVRFDAPPTLLEPVIRPTRQTGEETFVPLVTNRINRFSYFGWIGKAIENTTRPYQWMKITNNTPFLGTFG